MEEKEIKWTWYVFGKIGDEWLMQTKTHFDVPLWRRIITKIFMGSVWVRGDDNPPSQVIDFPVTKPEAREGI